MNGEGVKIKKAQSLSPTEVREGGKNKWVIAKKAR